MRPTGQTPVIRQAGAMIEERGVTESCRSSYRK